MYVRVCGGVWIPWHKGMKVRGQYYGVSSVLPSCHGFPIITLRFPELGSKHLILWAISLTKTGFKKLKIKSITRRLTYSWDILLSPFHDTWFFVSVTLLILQGELRTNFEHKSWSFIHRLFFRNQSTHEIVPYLMETNLNALPCHIMQVYE